MAHPEAGLVVLLLCTAAARPTTAPSDEMRQGLQASRNEYNQRVDWQPVKTFTFDNPQSLSQFKVVKGKWTVRDGKLCATEGPRGREILIAPCSWDMVRIAFDATLKPRSDGRICNLGVLLDADPSGNAYKHGYAMIAAQYWNQGTVCYRNAVPIGRTEWGQVVPNQTHHVVFEFTGDHLRYWIDQKVALDAWDRDHPLKMDPTRWIALQTYGTDMTVDNLELFSGTPIKRVKKKKE
jgi:predicted carbohydrate-binding protein with CBM5 and CBM33 domain